MKARLLTIILLVFTLAAFGQTSRRNANENRNNSNTKTTERKTTTTTERKGNQSGRNENVSTTQNRNTTTAPTQHRRTETGTRTTTTTTQRSTDNHNNTYTRQPSGNRNTDMSGGSRREGGDNRSNNHYGDNRGHNDYLGGNRGNDSYSRHYVNTRGRDVHYVYISRPTRTVVVHHSYPAGYRPLSIEVRRARYPYRAPVRTHIVWTVNLFNDFRIFYPEIHYWRYPVGYSIPSVPAYDADDYVGEVANIYGRVADVYYEFNSDNYYLYFGDYYPYQDFSVIIPGREARVLSRRPEIFFNNAYVNVTGYVTYFDNKPEIVLRRASQIDIY